MSDSRREQKDRAFLAIAHELGKLGTCDRKQVGAVFVIDGRCVTWGFNGAPPGLPHCEDNNHGWNSIKPEFDEHDARYAGCRNATHAEANALAFAARHGTSVDGATVYVTLSPCETCARLLVAAGVVRVVWTETYRDPAGSELLGKAGVLKDVSLPG